MLRVKKTDKGITLGELFKQWLCFFAERSSYNLSQFDALQSDRGYAAVIKNRFGDMVSSHTMKRFLRGFGVWAVGGCRWILKRLFLWRLRLKPSSAEVPIPVGTDAGFRRGYRGFYSIPLCEDDQKLHSGFWPILANVSLDDQRLTTPEKSKKAQNRPRIREVGFNEQVEEGPTSWTTNGITSR